MSSTRLIARHTARLLAVAAATVIFGSCDDGLFVEPAAGPAAVVISYSLTEAAAIVAGGPEAAFDAADLLRIALSRGEETVLDSLIPFVAAQETRVALTVPEELVDGALGVHVELGRGEDVLFRGVEAVQLERGQTNTVAVALDPVPSRIELDRAVGQVGLGDTIFLAGGPVFATGHGIPGTSLTWSADQAEVVELNATTGRLVGASEGSTKIRGSFAGLQDTMTVTIRSAVEAVTVSLPEELDVDETAVAIAEVRDRRGNVLARPIDWSTSDPAVATVDGSGLVRGVGDGIATITGMVEGKSGSALVQVRACVAPPPPLSEAPFRVSGSVARASGTAVDVVLNPILVDGRPVTGLNESNFVIVEDECQRPFTVTTSEGAIGIDLVFIQDLSGSMSGAITGVRNSVISFADQLAARGLDIRIGSVGYSGPTLIPSTPAGSISEYLGPVQDLTSPAEFQGHVTREWFASGGGDAPENGLEAIEYAHQNLSWRPGATRVMILITDISLHWSGSGCGCSDQTIESIAALIGGSTVVHAVAPADPFYRAYAPGVDAWLLAAATGGAQLELGVNGTLDLNRLEIESVLAETIRLTFESASAENLPHDLRVRVTLPTGEASDFVAEGIRYDPLAAELKASRFRTR
jgi:hypothetical protein